MTIGQSVKKGFSIAQSSWNLVALLFVFGLTWNLINLTLSARIPAEGNPDQATSIMMAVAGVIFVLVTIFFQAGSLGYVKEKIKAGSTSLKAFTESGRKFYVSILAIAGTVSLIIGVFALGAAFLAGALPKNFEILAAILAIVIAALGLSFVVLLFLAPYAVVADTLKASVAMKQSMGLVKKNIGIILGTSLTLIGTAFAIGLILGAVFAGINLLSAGIISQVVIAVMSSFVNAYIGVVVTGAFMALYFSLPKGSVAPNHN